MELQRLPQDGVLECGLGEASFVARDVRGAAAGGIGGRDMVTRPGVGDGRGGEARGQASGPGVGGRLGVGGGHVGGEVWGIVDGRGVGGEAKGCRRSTARVGIRIGRGEGRRRDRARQPASGARTSQVRRSGGRARKSGGRAGLRRRCAIGLAGVGWGGGAVGLWTHGGGIGEARING
uniref:Uncharacterized protein n=1 Tax=Setaria viridis TaxID=4556 RepID=A0A4U6U4F5_SETVI|nr:hypothetical protein SEVIR_6G163200v2 [Setaria viridis]